MPRRRRPDLPSRHSIPPRGLMAAVAAAALLLSACSSLPDSVNPVAWVDAITGTGPRGEVPGADAEYPNLASVPDGPRPATPESNRAAIAAGLTADRESARYTDQVLRGGVPVAPPPAQIGQAEPRTAPQQSGFQLVERDVPSGGAAQAPAPAPVAMAAGGERMPVGGTVPAPEPESLAGTIFFGPSSSRIGTADQELLALIAEAHRGHGGTVRIIGHASPDGSPPAAQDAASRQRAEVVAEALAALGVPRERLRVEWAGDSMPRAGGDAGAASRRVEIYLES